MKFNFNLLLVSSLFCLCQGQQPKIRSFFVPLEVDLHVLPANLSANVCGDGSCHHIEYTIIISNSNGDQVARETGHALSLHHYTAKQAINVPWPHHHLAVGGIRYYARVWLRHPTYENSDFIMDISDVVGSTELPAVDHAKVRSGAMTMTVTVTRRNHKEILVERLSPFFCGCVSETCSCCEHFDVPEISLNETGCANITYLPSDYGIRVQMELNDVVFFDEQISARNPPPLCANVPYVEDSASVCIWIHNITATDNTLFACVQVQFSLSHLKVVKYDLGCFKIGPLGTGEEQLLELGRELGDEIEEIRTDMAKKIDRISHSLRHKRL